MGQRGICFSNTAKSFKRSDWFAGFFKGAAQSLGHSTTVSHGSFNSCSCFSNTSLPKTWSPHSPVTNTWSGSNAFVLKNSLLLIIGDENFFISSYNFGNSSIDSCVYLICNLSPIDIVSLNERNAAVLSIPPDQNSVMGLPIFHNSSARV